MNHSLAFLKKRKQPPLDQVRFHREMDLSTQTVCLTFKSYALRVKSFDVMQLEHDRQN